MKSTSGLSICPRNWRAYADRDSTYRRWPSAKMVSKARLDLPEPDSPVNTIRESLGRSSDTSLRLCSRAPRTTRRSATALCSLEDPAEVKGHVMVSGGCDKTGFPRSPACPGSYHQAPALSLSCGAQGLAPIPKGDSA